MAIFVYSAQLAYDNIKGVQGVTHQSDQNSFQNNCETGPSHNLKILSQKSAFRLIFELNTYEKELQL